MRDPEPETGLNFNLLMPFALLAVLLVVPFSINSFMHSLAGSKRLANPVVMSIPIDVTAITLPTEVKQFESFEIALSLSTKHLANFLNEIVSISSEGTSIQGITGVVSPSMKAEIAGEHFTIDKQGPQEQLHVHNDITRWTWRVTPESSGKQELTFHLHLLTQHNGEQHLKVVDLADASLIVQANPSEWLKRHWIWIALLAVLPIAAWMFRQRHIRRSQ